MIYIMIYDTICMTNMTPKTSPLINWNSAVGTTNEPKNLNFITSYKDWKLRIAVLWESENVKETNIDAKLNEKLDIQSHLIGPFYVHKDI